jgi:serine/threonine protein kinase
MMDFDFLQGNQTQWRICRQLGEGDAGEVFLVESLRSHQPAILKRPKRSSFTTEIVRQASQIDTEARILRSLGKQPLAEDGSLMRIARLLDQSIPGNELTDRYFIVIEQATGFPLAVLDKLVRYAYQTSVFGDEDFDKSSRLYLSKLCERRVIPELLLLRVMEGVLGLFDAIHHLHGQWFQGEYHGILWNDIKLDHFFWDPERSGITIIDWGNGQFLDADGVTQDRLYSPADDYRQFLEIFGQFLAGCAPALHAALQWPSPISPADTSAQGILPLRERISGMVGMQTKSLREARLREVAVASCTPPEAGQLKNLEAIQRRIILHGELPDYPSAARAYERLANALVDEERWLEFVQNCARMAELPGTEERKWSTLLMATRVALECCNPPPTFYQDAIRAGLNNKWGDCMWSLCEATKEDPGPERWKELSDAVRGMVAEVSQPLPTPYGAALRLSQALEADRPKIVERLSLAIANGNLPDPENPEKLLRAYDACVLKLKDEVLGKWIELDPLPPYGDLSYSDVEAILGELDEIIPRLGIDPALFTGELHACLAQPISQTGIILDAWQAKGFKTASQGLRNLLLWDPDRRRVLLVEKAFQEAPDLLEEARRGPQRGERLQEYALRMEFHFRELRSRVSSTYWLGNALDLFSNLRSGKRPGDLLASNPKLADSFPWMRRYQRGQQSEKEANKETGALKPAQRREPAKEGKETRFGEGQEIFLGDALDVWVGEARGSSARVFQGFSRSQTGQLRQMAVKIMRPDKIDYASPLFFEEVQILDRMEDVKEVARMVECGFLQLDGTQELPEEHSQLPANSLSGKAIRYESNGVGLFLENYQDKIDQGWLPYLALEKKSPEDSLLLLCDEGYTRGNYLPLEVGLQIAVQICDILDIAHQRDIVYRDHKILHYYWNSRLRKVSMIDWNVARWYPEGIQELDIRMDLVQFGARALHHILTGRPAPGALPVGPNQPYEIEMAPQQYAAVWTYDDSQRIPDATMDLITRLLAGDYENVARLREDLLMQIQYRNE